MIDDSSKDLFRGKIIACQAQWIDRKSIGKSTKLFLSFPSLFRLTWHTADSSQGHLIALCWPAFDLLDIA